MYRVDDIIIIVYDNNDNYYIIISVDLTVISLIEPSPARVPPSSS